MSRHVSRPPSRGFTVIELAVGFVLLLTVGYLTLQFTLRVNRAGLQERATLQAQQEARAAIDGMSDELRLADPQQLLVPGWVAGVNVQGADGPGDPHWGRLQFRTWAWNAALNGGLGGNQASNWIEYQVVPEPAVPGLFRLERHVYVDDPPTVIDATQTTVLARNIYDEDADDDEVLDAGEDLNGNGILEPGVWFEVDREDNNGDGNLTVAEDGNGNVHFDGHVLIRISTQVATGQLQGRAAIVSSAQCRGGQNG